MSKQWEKCFICMEPNLCDLHHLAPKATWPEGLNELRDAPKNLIPLCKSCHEHVTWGMGELAFIVWMVSQIASHPGPKWARILLVKYYEAAVHALQARERLKQAGVDPANTVYVPEQNELPRLPQAA